MFSSFPHAQSKAHAETRSLRSKIHTPLSTSNFLTVSDPTSQCNEANDRQDCSQKPTLSINYERCEREKAHLHTIHPTEAAAVTTNTIGDILPYCIAEGHLTEAQVVAISDIAGSLKELMLLALQARGEENLADALVKAVGGKTAVGIVDFFEDEYEA